MTREEAIQVLTDIKRIRSDEIAKAIDMAIEALSADTVSREEYEELYRKAKEVNEMANDILADFPSYKELVSVVRCKDCRHWDTADGECYGHDFYYCSEVNDYCSRGERREE